MRKSVQEDCDIVNLSVGLNSIEPYSFYTKFMKQAADNDIVFTTAAGNRLDRWAGVQLFDVTSPGAFGSAVAVANLNNTANPGEMLATLFSNSQPNNITNARSAPPENRDVCELLVAVLLDFSRVPALQHHLTDSKHKCLEYSSKSYPCIYTCVCMFCFQALFYV